MRYFILLLAFYFSFSNALAQDLVVFAASSLTDVMSEIGKQFEAENKVKVKFQFEGSSRLARQIKEGAKADLFFSADKAWNDDLEKSGLVKKSLTQDLLSNSLVIVTNKVNKFQIKDLASLGAVKFKTLGLANESVPVGKFALEALKAVGVYDGIKDRIVTGDNVRNVLALVEKDEVDLGMVYSTDAKVSQKVKTLLAIPAKLHSAIIYPLSVTGTNPHAVKFYDFCRLPFARKVFEKAGFLLLGK